MQTSPSGAPAVALGTSPPSLPASPTTPPSAPVDAPRNACPESARSTCGSLARDGRRLNARPPRHRLGLSQRPDLKPNQPLHPRPLRIGASIPDSSKVPYLSPRIAPSSRPIGHRDRTSQAPTRPPVEPLSKTFPGIHVVQPTRKSRSTPDPTPAPGPTQSTPPRSRMSPTRTWDRELGAWN